MNVEKLPSGLWRVKVLVRSDYIDMPDGTKKRKRVFKSFLSDGKTLKDKKRVVAQAAAFEAEMKVEIESGLTFGQALDRYIESREATRSPRTIDEYRRIRKKEMQDLMRMRLDKISQEDIQREVDRAFRDHSQKTVRNWHGLVAAVLKEYRPDMRLNTHLPEKVRADRYIPSEDEIRQLMGILKGDPLELPVMLAAFGPMRRGEVCALRKENISGSRVHVCENMVKSGKEWTIKHPKTYAGDRYIDYPDFVAELWKDIPSGRITDLNPDNITNYFGRLLVRNGITDENGGPRYCFHSLRHFGASYLHALGIPNAYIMSRGGWDNETVLNNVYRHVLEQEEKKNLDIANEAFKNAFSQTVTTEVTIK